MPFIGFQFLGPTYRQYIEDSLVVIGLNVVNNCDNKKSTSVADRRYDKEVPLIRGINILIKRWCWKMNEEREEWKQKI